MLNRNKMRYLFIGVLGITILMTVFVVRNQATNPRAQEWTAEPLSFEGSFLSKDDWFRYAREDARLNGMLGDPVREQTALMTYGSYLTLTGEAGDLVTRDTPMFVYQVFGDVPELKRYGSAAGMKGVSGFIFVYDMTNGIPVRSTVLLEGKPGELDLSFIPADPGVARSLQQPILPTTPPDITPVPADANPESTAEAAGVTVPAFSQ